MTAVLFDMFGVIARLQSPSSRARLEQTAAVDGADFWDGYWALRPPYDRGDQSAAEYWGAVAAAVGTTFDERRVAELVAADVASWGEVDDDMTAYIRELAAGGTRIGLLSNIPEDLAADYERRHPWLRHFEVLAFSCRIGHAKPEPAAYHWCSKTFGLPPEDIVFVDDRTDNVLAAEAAGMRGHRFTSLAALREDLSDLP
ncbi:HAD family hydrolase [Streptomyces ficellus]|uniref:HAD family phosphatase n=1 Tax=Streptomyces ficellus TaxID=1977088 RepID=A0A6I6FFZ8_9ACTN|nr:HAD family phosphatase [Streptomyces ficellus]QGV77995.1 HAD family phosphatase [Streptomyces ficellus]